MRRFLDRLYGAALALAAVLIVLIGVLVFTQIFGRVLDQGLTLAGARPVGISVPSLAEIAGFLFAAAVALAMGGTFRAGGHVRVTMLLGREGPAARAAGILVLAAATALAGFMTWNMTLQVWDSWTFNSVSFGIVRIALWIPQAAMAAGFAIFLIATLDDLIAALAGRTPEVRRAELSRETAGGPADGH